MITRDAPRLICASSPNSRTRVTIRLICSSVAFGCVMMIIFTSEESSECRHRQFSASPDADASPRNLFFDRYWRTARNRFEKVFGHEFRHADATVRRGITGQITRMQSCPGDDAHKVRHRRALIMATRRVGVLGNV